MITKNINPLKKLLIVLCFVSGVSNLQANDISFNIDITGSKHVITNFNQVKNVFQQTEKKNISLGSLKSKFLDSIRSYDNVQFNKADFLKAYFTKNSNKLDMKSKLGDAVKDYDTIYLVTPKVKIESKIDNSDDDSNNNNDLNSGNDNSNDDGGDDDSDDGGDTNTDNNKKDNLDDPNKQDDDPDDIEEEGFWGRNKWYIIALSSTVVSIGVIGTMVYQKNKDDKKKRKK